LIQVTDDASIPHSGRAAVESRGLSGRLNVLELIG
jgi:hypothetical protein